ncbi:MAG: Ig-like domain-containing protein, partial [Lysobacterales bacterium]
RRNPHLRKTLAGVLLVGFGVAWAANFVSDGLVNDWLGVPAIGNDATGDATNGSNAIDIQSGFAAVEAGRVYFRIDVTDVENNPPVANPVSVTFLEDAVPQNITLSGTDLDSDPLTFTTTSVPTRGSLGAVIPVDATSATVLYTLTADENGADSFTYLANDTQADSADATVSITITPVNDAPGFTASDPPAVIEDAGAQSLVGWAVFSAGPANEAAQTVAAYNVSAISNGGLFSAAPAVDDNGTLSYTPADNTSGTSTFSLTVQDSGGTANGGIDTSVAQVFTITVANTNDAPSFTKGADQIVLEDAGTQTVTGWATAISAGPADESGQVTTFNITGNTNTGLFSTAPSVNTAGDLSYTPADNQNGSATITLTLSDDGGTANGGIDTSAPQTFVIDVTAVNDPPVILDKNAGDVQANMPRLGIDAGLLSGVTDLDTGVNGCTTIFSVASITDGTNGTVSNVNLGAGTFDFSPAPGYTGPATVNYTVSDDGCPGTASSAAATISLTVSSPIVWFVDDSAAGGGNGTLGSAFQTIGEATTAIGANTGQYIYVYSGTYTQGASLNADSRLIGEGLSVGTFDSAFGLTPPPGTAPRPALAGTSPQLGDTVTLHDNTHVRGLDIASTSNTGITATGHNGLIVNEVSVTSTTGTAVNVGTSEGTLSFTAVSADGATNGIVLNSTAGSFSVTGVGATAASGGTIQNTTGDAVSLTSAAAVSLSNMDLNDNLGNGIFGVSVDGLNLNGMGLDNNGDNSALDEAGINLTNLTGTSSWTNLEVSGSVEDNARIVNNASNILIQLTVSDSTFRDNDLVSGNNGLLIQANDNASMTVDISTTEFLRNIANGLQVVNNGTGDVDVELGTGVANSGGTHSDNNIAVNIAQNGTASSALNFDVRNINVTHATATPGYASPININLGTASTVLATIEGFVQNSILDNNESLTGPGIRVVSNGAGTLTVKPENNTFIEIANRGIEFIAREGSSRINATIHGNSINLTDAFSLDAVYVSAGVLSTDTNIVCLDLNGDDLVARRNTLTSAGANGARVRQRQAGTTFLLEDYAGPSNDTAAVAAFLAARNDGGDTFVADFDSTGFQNISDCSEPTP